MTLIKKKKLIWKDWNTFRKLMKNKLSNKLMSEMDLLIELYKHLTTFTIIDFFITTIFNLCSDFFI